MIGHRDAKHILNEIVGHGAATGHDQAAHRAEHRREGDRRDDRKQRGAERLGQEWRGHVRACGVEGAAGHRSEAQIEREHVEGPDHGDPHDRALTCRGGILHGVVADEDVRQRRRAAEERQHQAGEIEPVGELSGRKALEVAARLEQFGALALDGRIGGVGACGIGVFLARPGHDCRVFQGRQILKRPQRSGRGFPGVAVGQRLERADRPQVMVLRLRLSVDEHGAVGCDRANLRCEIRSRAGADHEAAVQDHRREDAAEKYEERPLDELHPGGGDHARGDDDHGDDHAHEDHTDRMRQAQQRHDQVARSDHLRNEIEDADDERRDRHRQFDAAAVEPAVEGVGEGELPKRLDRLGDHEQRHDPAGEKSDRIEKPVVAVEGDHPADAEERRRREVVAGEGNAVDEPVDLAVGGVVALGRLALAAEIERQPDDAEHKSGKDRDGGGGRFVEHRPEILSKNACPKMLSLVRVSREAGRRLRRPGRRPCRRWPGRRPPRSAPSRRRWQG